MYIQPKRFFSIVFCLIIFLFAHNVFAQDKIPSQLGLKGGLSFSHFRSLPQKGSSVTGFEAGIYKDYRFSSLFSVQPELMYVQEGGTVRQNNTSIGLHIEYIEVPLLAQIHPPIHFLNPRFFGGLAPAIKLVSYSDVKISDEGVFSPDQWDNHANDLVLGLVIGAGNDFKLSNRTLTIEIRYTHGITQTFDSQVPGSVKNSTLSLMAGFTF